MIFFTSLIVSAATAACTAAAAAGAGATISAGASVALAANQMAQGDYNVKFKLDLQNLSNFPLVVHENWIHSGHTYAPPESVYPGVQEAMAGHKTSQASTGCSGTVSWKIGDTGKMIVVMYSIPYSHDFHSNWIGVGIFNNGDTQGHYQKMYYESQSSFQRKDFYYDVDPVEYDDGRFVIRATCGTNHTPDIKVGFAPKQAHELAPSIQELMR